MVILLQYTYFLVFVSELFDEECLKEKVESVVEQKNVMLEHMYHKPLIDAKVLLETLHQYREMVEPL